MTDQTVTIQALRHEIIATLQPSLGDGESRAVCAVLFEDLMGVKPIDIALQPDRTLTDISVRSIREAVTRVVSGEPVQYVVGSALFHGLRLIVKPGVLIPRPETSQLVDIICDRAGTKSDLRVLDVCTGSGAIAAALGRSLNFPELTTVELSDTAIDVARENFSRLGLKISLIKSDVLTSPLPDGPFDIIVSNPPYVDNSERADISPRVLNYEPAMALFVPDENPLLFYRRIAYQAMHILSPGGSLYFEINPRHADDMAALLRNDRFINVEILRDFTGQKRFAVAQKTDTDD